MIITEKRQIEKKKHHWDLAFVATGLLMAYISFAYLGYLIVMDLNFPISEVSAKALGPGNPGETVQVEFTYTKTRMTTVIVESRWLICKDGTLFEPKIAASTATTNWPTGNRVSATLELIIPEKVLPNQTCYYGSTVRYPRNLLPDVILQNPPVDVEIEIR